MYGAAKDNVTHIFHEMSNPSEIAFTNYNRHAETALCSYQCSGTNAEFYRDLVYNSRISINLPGSERYVTTSAIDSLAGLQIRYYHVAGEDPKLRLTLSRDSVIWSAPIAFTDTTNLDTKQRNITATFTPGRYYVRISNTVGTRKVSIDRLVYSFGDCPNCFMYIEE